MFWEWDWNWPLFALYCFMCFIFGIIAWAISLPGLIAMVIAAIVGACAGSWEWFEIHGGNNDY